MAHKICSSFELTWSWHSIVRFLKLIAMAVINRFDHQVGSSCGCLSDSPAHTLRWSHDLGIWPFNWPFHYVVLRGYNIATNFEGKQFYINISHRHILYSKELAQTLYWQLLCLLVSCIIMTFNFDHLTVKLVRELEVTLATFSSILGSPYPFVQIKT